MASSNFILLILIGLFLEKKIFMYKNSQHIDTKDIKNA